MDTMIDDFLTRFAAGAGTLFEWNQGSDGSIRAKICDESDRVMCPLTAQYAIEYGPVWGEQGAGIAGRALEVSDIVVDVVIDAADNENMHRPQVQETRNRLLRITRVRG